MPRPRILITRLAAQAQHTAHALAAMGVEPVLAPLRTLERLAPLWPAKPAALLATSAQAFTPAPDQALGIPTDWAELPLFCVGATTLAAARKAGFAAAPHSRAFADVAALIAQIPPIAPLVYLAGTPRKPDLETALAPYALQVVPVYALTPLDRLPEAGLHALRANTLDAVLHFSVESARTFFALAEKAGLAAQAAAPVQICLSPAIAAQIAGLPTPPARFLVAQSPDLAALRATLAQWLENRA